MQTTTHPAGPAPAPAPAAPPRPAPPSARPGSPLIKYFLPGLALGVVIGAFAGAILPTMIGSDQPALRPSGRGDVPATLPPMTREEREAAEAAADQLRETTDPELMDEPTDELADEEPPSVENAPVDPEAEPGAEPPAP